MTLLFVSTSVFSQTSVDENYDFENPKDEIKYGVKQISRICPTFMWDSWSFKGISYDKEKNIVTITIQMKRKKALRQAPTSEEMSNAANCIVEKFMEGYEMIPFENSIFVDGDFMLYLFVGTLLRRMTDTSTSLEIELLDSTGAKTFPVTPTIKPDKLKSLVK